MKILSFLILRKETFQNHSFSNLLDSLICDSKNQSKYHQIIWEICNNNICSKIDEIVEDSKRFHFKVTEIYYLKLFKIYVN